MVVSAGFPPKFIENAETTDLITIAIEDLLERLDRRDQCAVAPEEELNLLTRSGGF
jgi:hypothetical protein